MRVLIVEDEQMLQESIVEYLSSESYSCDSATTFKDAYRKINNETYYCVLLDLGLPDGNGLDLIDAVKKTEYDPLVIVISAKNSLEDKIDGLDLGADDYITKPFHLSELNARIKAVARRKNTSVNEAVKLGDLTLDILNNQAFIKKETLNLTRKEFKILMYLVINRDKVISKTILVKHLWDDRLTNEDSYNFLFAHIKNLKKKLSDAKSVLNIRTVYGIGYQLLSNETI